MTIYASEPVKLILYADIFKGFKKNDVKPNLFDII